MKVPRKKKTQTKDGEIRKRLSTVLLFERLGLTGEWGDADFKVELPLNLPQRAIPLSPSTDTPVLEASLEALIRSGARRKVLYWCIGRLGTEAEAARQGVKHSGGVRDGKQSVKVVSIRPAMATRQDMAGLSSKVRSAAKAIQKYHEELLLLSEVCDDIEQPSGMLTGAELPSGALSLLLQSLYWVSKLSLQWRSPNATQLLKSKGLLFMLTYLWICAGNQKVPGGAKRTSGLSRSGTSVRLPNGLAQEVAMIAHIYLNADFTAGDLSDKLQDFADGEPALFRELLALMQILHSAAATT